MTISHKQRGTPLKCPFSQSIGTHSPLIDACQTQTGLKDKEKHLFRLRTHTTPWIPLQRRQTRALGYTAMGILLTMGANCQSILYRQAKKTLARKGCHRQGIPQCSMFRVGLFLNRIHQLRKGGLDLDLVK